jgi:hypothetical protein
MDITTGIKDRYWPSPGYAFGLANEALFCLLYKGEGGFRDGKDARIYVDKGYWSRSTAMQGQLTGLGTQED